MNTHSASMYTQNKNNGKEARFVYVCRRRLSPFAAALAARVTDVMERGGWSDGGGSFVLPQPRRWDAADLDSR